MDRQSELKELIKSLLRDTKDKINDNEYSHNVPEIIRSARNVVVNGKAIEKYLEELRAIEQTQS